MKKFRIMLPMLAFVFAVVGAVAGDLMPGIQAYRQVGLTCLEGTTHQNNCEVSNDAQPICTIIVDGTSYTAFQNANCTGVLRQQP